MQSCFTQRNTRRRVPYGCAERVHVTSATDAYQQHRSPAHSPANITYKYFYCIIIITIIIIIVIVTIVIIFIVIIVSIGPSVVLYCFPLTTSASCRMCIHACVRM
uniref:Uncharacterized protein n=1 Tax=Sipha flava TaxID=143950 RepID=A0A2S2QTP0_9HEMI